MADGARTHDNWNHNPGLYQLSYSHLWYCFCRKAYLPSDFSFALTLWKDVFQKMFNNEEAEF